MPDLKSKDTCKKHGWNICYDCLHNIPQLPPVNKLREVLVDLYYKGYHEGKGDAPNMDDIEITSAEQRISILLETSIAEALIAQEVETEDPRYAPDGREWITPSAMRKREYEARLDELNKSADRHREAGGKGLPHGFQKRMQELNNE